MRKVRTRAILYEKGNIYLSNERFFIFLSKSTTNRWEVDDIYSKEEID
jgi:hypothetical protein